MKLAIHPLKKLYSKAVSKSGMTLIEVLVSIAILSIIAIPFLTTMVSATKNNIIAKDKIIASTYAGRAIDEIKANSSNLKVTGNTLLNSENGYEVYYQIDRVDDANLNSSGVGEDILVYIFKINVDIKKQDKKTGEVKTIFSLVSYARK